MNNAYTRVLSTIIAIDAQPFGCHDILNCNICINCNSKYRSCASISNTTNTEPEYCCAGGGWCESDDLQVLISENFELQAGRIPGGGSGGGKKRTGNPSQLCSFRYGTCYNRVVTYSVPIGGNNTILINTTEQFRTIGNSEFGTRPSIGSQRECFYYDFDPSETIDWKYDGFYASSIKGDIAGIVIMGFFSLFTMYLFCNPPEYWLTELRENAKRRAEIKTGTHPQMEITIE